MAVVHGFKGSFGNKVVCKINSKNKPNYCQLARLVVFTGEFRNVVEITFRKFRYQNAPVPVGLKGGFEN